MARNTLLQNFLSTADRRFRTANREMSYGDWITSNTVLRGKPFSMDKYRFQREIADDQHHNLAVIKCSQVGLTEVQIRKVLAFAKRNKGVNAIYTLPDEKLFKKVSDLRVKPCIAENDVFQPDEGQRVVRNQSTFQFGTSFVLMANATEGAATSTPADYLMHDEVDLTDRATMVLFLSRLQNSEWKWRHQFSTPTFFGYGIDAAYEPTDQREYILTCPMCRRDQIPTFSREFVHLPGVPDEIEHLTDITEEMLPRLDLEAAHVMCQHCGTKLDLDDPGRRWVALKPDIRHARGYRVRPFSTSRIGIPHIIDQLVEYRRNDNLRGFFNTVMGEPYTDGNIRLERPAIERCFGGPDEPDLPKDAPHFLGIDAGATYHLVLGTGTRSNPVVRRFEQIPMARVKDRVAEICTEYNIVAGTVDRNPHTPTAHEIWELTGKKVWPTAYEGRLDVNLVFNEEKDPYYIQAGRTALIDAIAKVVRNGDISLSGYRHLKETVITHLRDMVRDEQPDVPAVWRKLNGQDHFFHALGYFLFSMRLGNILGEKVKGKEEVRTSLGFLTVNYSTTTNGLLTPIAPTSFGRLL